MKKLLFVFVVFVLIILTGCGGPVPMLFDEERMLYDIYPDTEEAPVLEFYWDGELSADNIKRITPYGVWEGPPGIYEPAVEMQFYTKTYHDPVLAVASGTITGIESEMQSLIVRYGKNYGVTYHHIVDIPRNFSAGDKVEAGMLLGYTQHLNNAGWWEVELNVKRGDVFRTLPAFDYFSEESQEELMFVLNSAEQKYEYTSWVERGDDTWIKDLGDDEWWSSPYRLGYVVKVEEQEDDFIKANNMSFMLGRHR